MRQVGSFTRAPRDELQMDIFALYTWMVTVLAGLLLFVIWIMEYDRSHQRTAPSRLPTPVIISHGLLGMFGLLLWIGYLVVDQQRLAWTAVLVLGMVALLGLIMAARWIRVYRTYAEPGASLTISVAAPPERNFPVPVVIGHGVLAFTTIGLVVVTALGVGGS
jgi:hypothetical protein